MKCPYCLDSFFEKWEDQSLISEGGMDWSVRFCICPACKKIIIEIGEYGYLDYEWKMVQPKIISRSPIPPEVDDMKLITDYGEACTVLQDSAKASAALSRRCLQYILREKGGVKPSSLDDEIQEIIDSNKLPTELANNLDYVRIIGNFAAHPIKSKNSGVIFDVEVGEAEYNLDIIEELFDFYFVRPARIKKKKEELNVKLREAGKPELPI